MSILSITLGVLFLLTLILYIRSVYKIKMLTDAFGKLFMLYNTNQSHDFSQDDYDVHRENFIKFLSDSREWAFNYIEEVQSGISKFISNVEPELDYYTKYGSVVEGMIPPHDKTLKKISQEFIELKKLLPEEPSDRR